MKAAVKILIVDDDRASAQAIAEVVHRLGFKSVVVSKPADALNVAKLQTVHAAVVDVLLPKMSGVDLAAEFRKTKFADNPVIFVSGVFRDRNFAQEAMKKTDALDFLFKPFGAEDLSRALKTALAGLIDSEKWTVQSLLTRPLKNAREKAKAIERLERIQGLELPFVLSLLTDAKISGHLNIVADGGEIFGITLSHGSVGDVDSSESQSTGVLSLISHGYLPQEDWDAFQQGGRRKFNLEKLVHEGLVSPHAVAIAKREQILEDLKAIFSASSIQVNFVRQDDVEETAGGVVSMNDLLTEISGALNEFFPPQYLENFYAPIADAAMQVAAPAQIVTFWRNPAFENLDGLRQVIDRGGTLTEALGAAPSKIPQVYAALHYLVLNRYVIFEDRARTQDNQQLADRFRNLHQNLVGKTPDQVFAYFGGKDRLNTPLVERIYAEYLRSNDPGVLPKNATSDVVELCRKCLEIVTAAYKVMSDDQQRQRLFEDLKAQENERAKRANDLVVKGLELLRKGQFAPAAELLAEAERTHATALGFLIRTWAEVKGQAINSRDRLIERHAKIEALPSEDRRSAYYHMALGLVKQALGDRAAQACFEKTLELDSTMAEARRELNAAALGVQREKKQDILTGDITSIVTGFFRRKAD